MANLYGLIDCARDPRLYSLVKRTGLHSCLFAGDIHPDLAPASPHIVQLDETERFLRIWREEGWGQSWGIMCESNRTLSEVRRHFRHFLRVQLPDKRVVLFRFYDPRVFRVYLPSCTPDDLRLWFQGILRFIVEDSAGEAELSYLLPGGANLELSRRNMRWSPRKMMKVSDADSSVSENSGAA